MDVICIAGGPRPQNDALVGRRAAADGAASTVAALDIDCSRVANGEHRIACEILLLGRVAKNKLRVGTQTFFPRLARRHQVAPAAIFARQRGQVAALLHERRFALGAVRAVMIRCVQ